MKPTWLFDRPRATWRGLLVSLCGHSRDEVARHLAQAALEGDGAALHSLWDRLQETGEGMMHSLQVGECYLVRVAGGYYTGRVKRVSLTEVVLGEAAWIDNIGPYHKALRTGNLQLVDPYPDEVLVSAWCILDAVRWPHPLPREPKEPPEIPF
jgi:hypothetical protein